MRYLLVISLFLILNLTSFPLKAADTQEVIDVAVIDWCPQICPDQPDAPGYIIDIANSIFQGSKYKLRFVTLPWTRAINNTRSGKTLALLAPAKPEAPDLIYPDHPIGTQRMCFFTKASNDWGFNGKDSLKGMRIGIAEDTDIGELNAYAAAHPSQFEYRTYSDQYLKSSLQKVASGRLDTFLFTLNTTNLELQKLGWKTQFKSAGCVMESKVYMALSPAVLKSEKVEELLSFVNQAMDALKASTQLDKIFEKYALENRLKQ